MILDALIPSLGLCNGVLRTRVGYCGGTKEKPTYRSLGDHTEAISVDFDPTGDQLRGSSPSGSGTITTAAGNIGMRAVHATPCSITTHEQKKIAARRPARRPPPRRAFAVEKVRTAILPVGHLHLRRRTTTRNTPLTPHRELRAFLSKTYPSGKALADSTVATRLNAWLGSGFDRDPAVLAEGDRQLRPPRQAARLTFSRRRSGSETCNGARLLDPPENPVQRVGRLVDQGFGVMLVGVEVLEGEEPLVVHRVECLDHGRPVCRPVEKGTEALQRRGRFPSS